MTRLYRYILLLPLILMVSCTSYEMQEPDDEAVTIAAGIGGLTRVSEDGLSFSDADVIKVQNTSGDEYNLSEFTYDLGRNVWVASDRLLWNGTENNEFKAWHPSSASFEEFTVPADQSEGLDGGDWMTASASAKKSDGELVLTFVHHLAKVTVNIESWGDTVNEDDRESSKLNLLSLSTVMSNDGTSISGDAVGQYVLPYTSTPLTQYSAILAPGHYDIGDEIIRVYVGADPEPMTVLLDEELELLAGKAYTFALTVGRDGVKIAEDGVSVGDWTDGELLDPTLEPAQFSLPEGVSDTYENVTGPRLEIPLNVNVDYDVKAEDANGVEVDWITVEKAEVKSVVSRFLAILLKPNFGTAARSACVRLINEMLDKEIEINISQAPFEGVPVPASFDEDKYLLYTSNHYSSTSGGIFDTDIYSCKTYITNPCRTVDVKWEFKFKLAYEPSTYSDYTLMSDYHGRDNTSDISITGSGISYYSWEDMGVNPTDEITVCIDNQTQTMTVNGNTLGIPRVIHADYFFSGYYYDTDDGVYETYYGFQDDARLYYVKAWDSNGRLVYVGGPSMQYNASTGEYEACWTASYISETSGQVEQRKTFAYYRNRDEYSPFGVGNLMEGDPIYNAVSLSDNGTANCYIVSEAGSYKFPAKKGNSNDSVGAVASVEALWESFGTGVTPAAGDLIRNVQYGYDYIAFSTPDTFKEGNAVIAAKDASGKILWSWHIWLTDGPQGQVYNNSAGTMMDRNLGATSAEPGSVGALGLFYQWGRKDPFTGSSSISQSVEAKSTISWPSPVVATETTGTVEYATAHPTTFIYTPEDNYSGTSTLEYTQGDWNYSSRNDNLWTSEKTVYDPCPPGWRVPDGYRNSIWAIAFDSPENILGHSYNSQKKGIDFAGNLGADSSIWYPVAGCIFERTGYLSNTGSKGYCHTVTPAGFDGKVRSFDFDSNGWVVPSFDAINRAGGYSVRCCKIHPEPLTEGFAVRTGEW